MLSEPCVTKQSQNRAVPPPSPHPHPQLCLITYTTQYREGGAELAVAAETHAELRRAEGWEVLIEPVESKGAFVRLITELGGQREARGAQLKELAFFGHSGLYGPMFRTTSMPEQLSPHEWRELVGRVPFSAHAEAHFYACRTARWFAPFFARTFGVRAGGFHEYTSFSSDPERFVLPRFLSPWSAERERSPHPPLYLKGCRGKKSDGVLGSLKKYLGTALEPMTLFEPEQVGVESSYAHVAHLYDEVFADIRVRRDEWRWLQGPLQAAQTPAGEDGLSVLDIGCGNGALLAAISEVVKVREGLGLDASPEMISLAQARQAHRPQLRFEHTSTPSIPLPDASVDLALSLLSWRYLDWDPLMIELMRVIKPGGRLVVIDMVTAPPSLRELPALARDTLKGALQRRLTPTYQAALKRLTAEPAWAEMLRYNPMRAQHELVWYFESRFQGRRVEVLNIGRRARVLAFDSGPLSANRPPLPQSYP